MATPYPLMKVKVTSLLILEFDKPLSDFSKEAGWKVAKRPGNDSGIAIPGMSGT